MNYPQDRYGLGSAVSPNVSQFSGAQSDGPTALPALEEVEQRIQASAKRISETTHKLHFAAERLFGSEPPPTNELARGEALGKKLAEVAPRDMLTRLHTAIDGLDSLACSLESAADRLTRL